MTPEDEIRALVEERIAAVATKDPKPLAARQHPEIVHFNLLPPLHSKGNAAVEQATRDWFDGYETAIGYGVRDLTVHVDRNVAFCSFLYHVTGTLKTGGEVDMWVRATLGCRKVDGRWVIVHDHESVPFDATTGRALIDLEP